MIYRDISTYVPKPGDMVIWRGWFVTWYGEVVQYNHTTQELQIVFEGSPQLLSNLTSPETKASIYKVDLSKITTRRWSSGFYVQQVEYWYV